MLQAHDLVLFQGDSITDTLRNKDQDGAGRAGAGRDLGRGYASMCAAQLGLDRAELHLDVRNLGISGNRITDFAARIKEHCWNLRPDVLSILLGVNDLWHHHMRDAGVELPRYERTYRQALSDTRARLPGVRLVLCEPFVLPCGAVQPAWRGEIDGYRAVVQSLAREFDARFVAFQGAFDQALRRAPAEHWAPDGVHPSPAGHLLMARTWLEAVR